MNASKLEQNLTGVIVEMALKMGLCRAAPVAQLPVRVPCAHAGRASQTAGG